MDPAVDQIPWSSYMTDLSIIDSLYPDAMLMSDSESLSLQDTAALATAEVNVGDNQTGESGGHSTDSGQQSVAHNPGEQADSKTAEATDETPRPSGNTEQIRQLPEVLSKIRRNAEKQVGRKTQMIQMSGPARRGSSRAAYGVLREAIGGSLKIREVMGRGHGHISEPQPHLLQSSALSLVPSDYYCSETEVGHHPPDTAPEENTFHSSVIQETESTKVAQVSQSPEKKIFKHKQKTKAAKVRKQGPSKESRFNLAPASSGCTVGLLPAPAALTESKLSKSASLAVIGVVKNSDMSNLASSVQIGTQIQLIKGSNGSNITVIKAVTPTGVEVDAATRPILVPPVISTTVQEPLAIQLVQGNTPTRVLSAVSIQVVPRGTPTGVPSESHLPVNKAVKLITSQGEMLRLTAVTASQGASANQTAGTAITANTAPNLTTQTAVTAKSTIANLTNRTAVTAGTAAKLVTQTAVAASVVVQSASQTGGLDWPRKLQNNGQKTEDNDVQHFSSASQVNLTKTWHAVERDGPAVYDRGQSPSSMEDRERRQYDESGEQIILIAAQEMLPQGAFAIANDSLLDHDYLRVCPRRMVIPASEMQPESHSDTQEACQRRGSSVSKPTRAASSTSSDIVHVNHGIPVQIITVDTRNNKCVLTTARPPSVDCSSSLPSFCASSENGRIENELQDLDDSQKSGVTALSSQSMLMSNQKNDTGRIQEDISPTIVGTDKNSRENERTSGHLPDSVPIPDSSVTTGEVLLGSPVIHVQPGVNLGVGVNLYHDEDSHMTLEQSQNSEWEEMQEEVLSRLNPNSIVKAANRNRPERFQLLPMEDRQSEKNTLDKGKNKNPQSELLQYTSTVLFSKIPEYMMSNDIASQKNSGQTELRTENSLQSSDHIPLQEDKDVEKEAEERISHYSIRSRCKHRAPCPSSSRARPKTQSPTSLKPKRNRRSQSPSLDWEEKQMVQKDRRVLYVGGIPDYFRRDDLEALFIPFGRIVRSQVFIRQRQDSYGFVSFETSEEANRALEECSKDPKFSRYQLSYGGRREFCSAQYADLDGNQAIEEEYTLSVNRRDVNEDYEHLLRKVKHSQIQGR